MPKPETKPNKPGKYKTHPPPPEPPPPEPPPPEPPPPEPPPPEPPPPSGVRRITIDPVTRIEGHLSIEVEVTNGEVTNAWSSGSLFRGVEIILKDRNPEDAWLFTQRLCGVCTYVHGSTSVRCVEDALGLTIPDNARIIRNLLMGGQFLHDHIVHFYILHALDWVDIVSALEADPAQTSDLASSVSPKAAPIDFQAVKNRLASFVGTGKLGPFAGAYWGHPAYVLSPEENLLAAAHYIAALRLQARVARLHGIFGGKNPHVQSLRVGGVTCRDDLNSGRISEFRSILRETREFVDTVYIPDVILLAKRYGAWGGIGGSNNFLAYGEFPQSNEEPASLFFPQGVIRGGPFNRVEPVDLSLITEHVSHSWYQGSADRHPYDGETMPNYTGRDTAGDYSWLKAPRYEGDPMEVGPLARMLVAYGSGQPEATRALEDFLNRSGLPAGAVDSTLGRAAARALETKIIGDAMDGWLNELSTAGSTFRPSTMPMQAGGVGLNEAPRGALGHWIVIGGQKIENYQMVVPSTWNLGPRCARDKPGPVEAALIGTPVADPERPVEVLRLVHSFDPCIACAVHVIDTRNDKVYKVRAV